MRYGEQVFEVTVSLDGVDWAAADPLPADRRAVSPPPRGASHLFDARPGPRSSTPEWRFPGTFPLRRGPLCRPRSRDTARRAHTSGRRVVPRPGRRLRRPSPGANRRRPGNHRTGDDDGAPRPADRATATPLGCLDIALPSRRRRHDAASDGIWRIMCRSGKSPRSYTIQYRAALSVRIRPPENIM